MLFLPDDQSQEPPDRLSTSGHGGKDRYILLADEAGQKETDKIYGSKCIIKFASSRRRPSRLHPLQKA